MDRAPKQTGLDPGLSPLIFVQDLVSPRAKVALAELIRQSGQRPHNLRLVCAREEGRDVPRWGYVSIQVRRRQDHHSCAATAG